MSETIVENEAGQEPADALVGAAQSGVTSHLPNEILRPPSGVRTHLQTESTNTYKAMERTVSWLSGCRRLHRRYERKPEHFLAFTAIAATLICHRRLAK